MATRIQVRRGTTSQWNTANPTLEEGEIGYNSTLGQIKVGDGTSVWADLDYFVSDTSLGTSLGAYLQDSDKSAIDGVAELDGSKNILAPASIIFEGTANDHETTLAVTDPTADRTITLPNVSGTVITTGNLSDITNIGVFTSTIVMEGSTANDFELTLSAGDPTADRTITFPDATGTVALTTDIAAGTVTETGTQTLTNKSISLGSNTVTSTLAQLNTAISDADVASLAGTETLTNKTLTSPVINTPTGITKTDVGLANVDNTTDANKPVSTATQTALDLKANLANPTFTGTVNAAALTLSGDLTVNGTTTTVNSTTVNVSNAFVFEGTANDFETTLTITDPTADRTITLPDATGTVALTSDITVTPSSTSTLTNKTLTSPKINEDVAVTATATELNYVDGVTSAIQTQIDGKSPTAGNASLVTLGTVTTGTWSADTIAINKGGTGATTAMTAATALLPAQTSNSGKYLTNDGAGTLSWETVAGYSAPTLGSTSIASGATVTTIAGLTLSNATLSGSLTAGGGTGSSGQILQSTGSGVQWATPAAGAAFSEFMLIGC
jgi:hypothetical protein